MCRATTTTCWWPPRQAASESPLSSAPSLRVFRLSASLRGSDSSNINIISPHDHPEDPRSSPGVPGSSVFGKETPPHNYENSKLLISLRKLFSNTHTHTDRRSRISDPKANQHSLGVRSTHDFIGMLSWFFRAKHFIFQHAAT